MLVRAILVLCSGVLLMASPGESAPADLVGRVTGIGGVFFKAKDPKALAATCWACVAILKRDDNDPNGRFAWILDPENNKIELWEPKRAEPR